MFSWSVPLAQVISRISRAVSQHKRSHHIVVACSRTLCQYNTFSQHRMLCSLASRYWHTSLFPPLTFEHLSGPKVKWQFPSTSLLAPKLLGCHCYTLKFRSAWRRCQVCKLPIMEQAQSQIFLSPWISKGAGPVLLGTTLTKPQCVCMVRGVLVSSYCTPFPILSSQILSSYCVQLLFTSSEWEGCN